MITNAVTLFNFKRRFLLLKPLIESIYIQFLVDIHFYLNMKKNSFTTLGASQIANYA